MAESTDSQTKWYSLTAEAVAQQLKVDPAKGLSASRSAATPEPVRPQSTGR